MASFFDDEAEVGTTDDEDEMETEGTLKVRKFKVENTKFSQKVDLMLNLPFQHCNEFVQQIYDVHIS